MLREFIKEEIALKIGECDITFNDLEMEYAVDGVEYWITSGLNGSIDTSIDNILRDRNKTP